MSADGHQKPSVEMTVIALFLITETGNGCRFFDSGMDQFTVVYSPA